MVVWSGSVVFCCGGVRLCVGRGGGEGKRGGESERTLSSSELLERRFARMEL